MNQEFELNIERLIQIGKKLEDFAIAFGEKLPPEIRNIFLSPPVFDSTSELARFKSWVDGMEKALEFRDDLLCIKNFIDRAEIPDREKELYLAYISLKGELEFENLIRNPSVVPAIVRAFEVFYSLYAEKYRKHHDELEKKKDEFREKFGSIYTYARAILHLSQIEGLCSVEAIHRSQKFMELFDSLSQCKSGKLESYEPFCGSCGMSLGFDLDEQEFENLARDVKNDVTGVLNEISKVVIRGLAKKDKKVDAFVDAVVVSNLDGFVKLLDDELVQFLKEVIDQSRKA